MTLKGTGHRDSFATVGTVEAVVQDLAGATMRARDGEFQLGGDFAVMRLQNTEDGLDVVYRKAPSFLQGSEHGSHVLGWFLERGLAE